MQQSLKQRIQLIRELSKSGIVTLVLISVLAGYFIGQSPELPLESGRMMMTLLGILFLASGSSALNQLQEKDVDRRMPRTAGRPFPSGRLSPQAGTLFILLTLGLGTWILWNLGTALFYLGVSAVVFYNGLYTLWWKKYWSYAAIPGAIPGALPIFMGHVAASKQVFHPGGIYLFFLLFFWQMPHFWVLALRYQKDYAQGGFPTLPVSHGAGVTVHQIVIWCLAYLALAFMGPFFLPVGSLYLFVTCAMSFQVLRQLRHFKNDPESREWLHFFLWINMSLVVFLGAAALDLWSIFIPIPSITR